MMFQATLNKNKLIILKYFLILINITGVCAQDMREIEVLHSKLLSLSQDRNFEVTYVGILSRTSQDSGLIQESVGKWSIFQILNGSIKTLTLSLLDKDDNSINLEISINKVSYCFNISDSDGKTVNVEGLLKEITGLDIDSFKRVQALISTASREN